MPALTDFSPAELLLIVHERNTPSLRQLLRLTFLDLLRKEVLSLEHRHSQPHPSDPAVLYTFVCAGPKLGAYSYLPHEKPLLDLFLQDPSFQTQFRQYVRMLMQRVDSSRSYHQLILQNERTGELFTHDSWWRRMIGYITPTPQGVNFEQFVRAELIKLDKQLAQYASQPTAQTQTWLRNLEGLLFLLPSFISPIGRQLETEMRELEQVESHSDAGGSTWNDCGDAFDSHCPSHDGHSGCGGDGHGHSGDSGCSSGCSGCSSSGCSGCSSD
jgi:hypothetical protein